MSNPETRRIVLAVLLWQRLREPHLGDQQPRIPSDADADHSALLERLLVGKTPFPSPPPTSYSYPWYDLVENSWALAGCEAWQSLPQEYGRYPDWLHFQQSIWQIDSRYEIRDHPAWGVHHPTGWRATVEWEEGPFVVGRNFQPSPHDILQPAYVVRLTDWQSPSTA